MIITYISLPERWIEFKKKVMKCVVCKSEEGKGGEDMRLLRVFSGLLLTILCFLFTIYCFKKEEI